MNEGRRISAGLISGLKNVILNELILKKLFEDNLACRIIEKNFSFSGL